MKKAHNNDHSRKSFAGRVFVSGDRRATAISHSSEDNKTVEKDAFKAPYTEEDFARIFQAAYAAGNRAAKAMAPPVLIVADRESPNGTLRDQAAQKVWIDSGGSVGTASIAAYPGTRQFCRWLVRNGFAGRRAGGRGILVRASCTSQSIHKSAAFALAFVRELGRADLGLRMEVILRYD